MASGFLVEKDYTTPSGVLARDVAAPRNAGAGDGNRTHIASLEGWSSTIELHPHSAHQRDPLPLPDLVPTLRYRPRFRSAGGGGRIRTYEDVRRQIYSLLPLTARQPLRDRVPPGAAEPGS